MKTFSIISVARNLSPAVLVRFDADYYAVSDHGNVRFYTGSGASRQTVAVYKLDNGQYVK